MASRSRWGRTPRQSIESACAERGRPEVVAGCVALLSGEPTDPALVFALGGPPARWAVDGGEPGPAYWLRVWAARGLLWAWDDSAVPGVRRALHDDEWRVREMAAKVCARHLLAAALTDLARLEDDPRPRVRAAAHRAVVRIVGSDA